MEFFLLHTADPAVIKRVGRRRFLCTAEGFSGGLHLFVANICQKNVLRA
jgi:hypothetical protein